MKNMNTNSGTAALKAATDKLATVFGHYKGKVDWSDKSSSKTSELTTQVKVEDLGDEDYAAFCWHSGTGKMTKKRAVDAVHYFLPRLAAELSTGQCAPWCEDQFAFMLHTADWLGWKGAERDAVEAWFTAWLNVSTEMSLAGDSAHLFISAFHTAGCCGYDVTSYLARWLEDQEADGVILVSALLVDFTQELLHAGWPPGWDNYWEHASAPRNETTRLIRFFLSKEVRTAIDIALDTCKKKTQGSELFKRADVCLKYLNDFGDQHEDTPMADAVHRNGKIKWHSRPEDN